MQIDGVGSTKDIESLTIGNTRSRSGTILSRLDPPNPLPVGNVCSIGELLAKEDSLK